VSLFGIVNTPLTARATREIAAARDRLTRRQTRRMIRHERHHRVIGVRRDRQPDPRRYPIAKVDFLEFAFPTTQIIVFTIAAIIDFAAIFRRRAAKSTARGAALRVGCARASIVGVIRARRATPSLGGLRHGRGHAQPTSR
jgi:hypothetical protein